MGDIYDNICRIEYVTHVSSQVSFEIPLVSFISDHRPSTILVTGATGYIGGRLVPLLIERGFKVRCLVRDRSRIEGRGWPGIEAVTGDALRYETLVPAMKEVQAAYYLIHSMAAGESKFEEQDRLAAENFGRAAREAGIERIIYLGGLGSEADSLSSHLKSRQEIGQILAQSGVPVTEFRAGVIVGSGSLSFELVRYLTERIPVMICPKWVKTLAQPIAVRDVLRYLTDCLQIPESKGRILEIGGADVVSYGDMMLIYARLRRLKRWLIDVPVLTPRLSSYWINLVTPIPATIARPLVQGLKNEVVCREHSARRLFEFTPLSYEEAVKLALQREESGQVETIWSAAFSTFPQLASASVQLRNTEGMIIERRTQEIRASVDSTYKVVSCIGGKKGWFYADFLWQLRGILDRLSGGVGMRRGRRSPNDLRVGDPLDFWRVEAVEKNHLIRLRAEMKVPGKAWLQFEFLPDGEYCRLVQTAFFEPRGLAGHLYWYLLYPAHRLIFKGLVKALAQKAEASEQGVHQDRPSQ